MVKSVLLIVILLLISVIILVTGVSFKYRYLKNNTEEEKDAKKNKKDSTIKPDENHKNSVENTSAENENSISDGENSKSDTKAEDNSDKKELSSESEKLISTAGNSEKIELSEDSEKAEKSDVIENGKNDETSETDRNSETDSKTNSLAKTDGNKFNVLTKDFAVNFRQGIADSKKFFIASAILYVIVSVFIGLCGGMKDAPVINIVQSVILFDILFLISSIDIKIKKIPNKLLLVLLCVRIICMAAELINNPSRWMYTVVGSLLGFLFAGLIILICIFVSRGGIGSGDMKLFAIIGLFYHINGVLEIMMYSLFLASIVSIFLLVTKKAKAKSSIPMAPFICMGLFVYLFFIFA